MIEEKDLNSKILQSKIQSLFCDEKEMEIVSECAKKLGKPKAAYDIIQACQKLVG